MQVNGNFTCESGSWYHDDLLTGKSRYERDASTKNQCPEGFLKSWRDCFSLSPSAPDHLSPEYPSLNRGVIMAKIHVPENKISSADTVCGQFWYRCKQ